MGDLVGHCRRDQFTLDLMEKVPQGAGSGTIWDTDGHVVTNAHVIAGASDLQVRRPLPHWARPRSIPLKSPKFRAMPAWNPAGCRH